MMLQTIVLIAIFSFLAHSLENPRIRSSRQQTKIMKLKPQGQSTEAFHFIETTYTLPSKPAVSINPNGFIERLEVVSGISVGKEIEPILMALSSKLLADLGTKFVDQCVIVGIETSDMNIFESFHELCTLAAHAGVSIVGCESQKTVTPTDDQIFGNGKIKQIASQLIDHSIHTVVFDGELSPIQLRNLEDALLNELPTGRKKVKVMDKTSIILDIISKNSKSAESSMQAELAMAMYRLPRMTTMWITLAKVSEHHLSIGTRGPGGKNLDLDFKQMRKRISCLKKTLDDVRTTRTSQRQARKSRGFPSIAIVGYMGCGKTSLQNALSCSAIPGCKIDEENSPFKTLEAVTRRVSVPKKEKLPVSNSNPGSKLSASRSVCPDFLLIDTMSLIDKLPQCVLSAFKMNFEELEDADILVNVCDISNSRWQEQEKYVLATLNEIEGIDNKPIITVWSMLDRFSDDDIPRIQQQALSRPHTVAISSHCGLGFDNMLRCFNEVMVESLMSEVKGTLSYSPQNLALLSKLQQSSSFDVIEYTNKGVKLEGKIPMRFVSQFSQSITAVKVKTKAAKSSLMRAFLF